VTLRFSVDKRVRLPQLPMTVQAYLATTNILAQASDHRSAPQEGLLMQVQIATPQKNHLPRVQLK
jgi:hypothetical protein